MRSELRIAHPWVRDLRSGAARRHSPDGTLVATVARHSVGWKWSVFPLPGTISALTREDAKNCADAALRRAGWEVLEIPGGCVVEKE